MKGHNKRYLKLEFLFLSSLVLLLFLDGGSFEVLRNVSVITLLVEIIVRVGYCIEKNRPKFSIVYVLIVKSEFFKNDQNFAVKALGCAPWFPT